MAKMNKRTTGMLAGLLVLVLAIVLVSAGVLMKRKEANKPKPEENVTVSGFLGGEKIGLFEDQAFKDYVSSNYHVNVNYKKNGSIEMVTGDSPKGQDYLFPSSQTAESIYKQNNKALSTKIEFNTPIVVYSWKPIVDKLEKAGLVSKQGTMRTLDMVKLSQLLKENKTWKDVGVDELYGSLNVSTTDPNESNSGTMFLGLLANALNDNKPIRSDDVKKVKPVLKDIYQRTGYMNGSSADAFQQYLSQGMGAFPLLAGYENQLLEFSKENPDTYQNVKDNIVTLYPTPTVWSSHVFISQTENAQKLEKALSDPDMQNLAWREHGFRTAVTGETRPQDFESVPNVPQTVNNIMPLPSSQSMQELMRAVK